MRIMVGDMFDTVYVVGDKVHADMVPVWRIPLPDGRRCCVASLENERDNALRRAWIKAEQKEKSKDGWHLVKDPSWGCNKTSFNGWIRNRTVVVTC